MLAGLPVLERRPVVEGTATTLLEGGEGPPLVLLHGGIECGGAYWAPVIPALAGRQRLVVPDLPGLGESDPIARLDFAALVNWLAGLVRATCAEPPVLVAHSLMGSLAARFAARHGDLLDRLVIYGAPGIGTYRIPLGLRVVALRFALNPSERNGERFERWAFFDLEHVRGRDPGWFEAFGAYLRARARIRHVKRTMAWLISSCTKRIADHELRRIQVRTALVWGRHDRFVPLAVGEGASTRLGWPLQVIEDCGHAPHIECPEDFLRAVAAEPAESRR